MRRIFLLSIALVSVALGLASERRPRFGGTLRVELRATELPPELAGPFKVVEPGKLAANDAFPGGRPFLDSIEVQLGRSLRDQALDFELGKADVIEVSPVDVARLKQRGASVMVTQPRETLALVCDQPQEALAVSIDRAAIHSVILQRAGESTGALLPQWITGYAFLFAPLRDLGRAKRAAKPAPLSFAYDRDDPVMRAIAERIVVNAAEGGVTLRAAAASGGGGGAAAGVRLVRLRVALNLTITINGATITADNYDAERAALADFRVIPLFHLPLAYQLSPRVKGGPRYEDMWVTQ